MTHTRHRRPLATLCLIAATLATSTVALADEKKEKPAALVWGTTGVLRKAPKKYAAFVRVEPSGDAITVHVEGEDEPATWPLSADAEVKVRGWWGRLSQLREGDRVWLWFQLDHSKKPRRIFMVTDELSRQELNDLPYTLSAIDPEEGAVSLKPAKGDERRLRLGEGVDPATLPAVGDTVYVQSAGGAVRLLVDAEKFGALRNEQRTFLRELWKKEGLPGTATFLHPFGGELDVILDHEAMRWSRNLETGDRVELIADGEPIEAVVKTVLPWRERTQLRLVADGYRQADLAIGQRIHLRVPEPPPEVRDSDLPPDLDRPRSRDERILWFLSSTYCTCSIGGDGCTGMVYTLASCDPNRCGMPKRIRGLVEGMLDEGLSDRGILEKLLEQRGRLLLKQHLLR